LKKIKMINFFRGFFLSILIFYFSCNFEKTRIIETYDNGVVKKEEILKKNNLISIKSYYENGAIESEHNYKDSLKDGEFKFYREDGTLAECGNYRDGYLYGQMYEFTPERFFKNIKEYNINGNIIAITKFKENGIKNYKLN